jgi:hypothetical protein
VLVCVEEVMGLTSLLPSLPGGGHSCCRLREVSAAGLGWAGDTWESMYLLGIGEGPLVIRQSGHKSCCWPAYSQTSPS